MNQDDIIDPPVWEAIDMLFSRINELYYKETISLETAATIVNVKESNPILKFQE